MSTEVKTEQQHIKERLRYLRRLLRPKIAMTPAGGLVFVRRTTIRVDQVNAAHDVINELIRDIEDE